MNKLHTIARRFHYLTLFIVTIMLAGACQQQSNTEPRILVFSKTTGWRHTSIPHGIEALQKLGKEHGFLVDTTENASKFNDKNLKKYHAIVFLNTSGRVFNPQQKASFQRYIQAGGGYVGIHSASTTEYEWTWFGNLMGAHFANHPHNPGVREATITVLDKQHPSTVDLPDEWFRNDEWYNFRSFYPGIKVLANLDETTYEGGTHGSDHPIAWYQEYDGGRAFYTAGGHTEESYSEPLFLKHLLGGIKYAMGDGKLDYSKATATEVPEENRFVKTILVENLKNPMELAIAEDGRIFFTELRTGSLNVYDPKTAERKVVHQFDVTTRGGTGLIGIALDPNFLKNSWLYLYYAPIMEGEPIIFNLSRFTLTSNNTIDPQSEKVLLQVPVEENSGSHHGGSLAWDEEGNLLLSTGDSSSPFSSDGYAPLDERPGKQYYSLDAQRSAANTNDLKGKILRIRPQPDGTYTIPEGNLFAPGTPKTRPEIYVMGCRNPYRIAVNKKTGSVYWGDNGPDAGTESERGPRGYDEFNQAKEAGNYGWPYFVGDNYAYAHWDFETKTAGSKFDPLTPINNSPNNTGLAELPPAQPAMIWYPYAPSEEFPELGQGGRSAMVGDFFHYNKASKAETGFPQYYDNSLFVFDWMRNWVMAIRFDENENLKGIEPFMATNGDFRRPIDLAFDKDGIMYMLEYGSVYGLDNEDARLVKIDYNRGNRPPEAIASVLDSVGEENLHRTVFLTSELRTLPLKSEVVGPAPLRVLFTSRGSGDPDSDDIVSYKWQLEGEGVTSTDPHPAHTYSKPGVYYVVLELKDQAGLSHTDTVIVKVGNTQPDVTITSPHNKSFFWENKPFKYKVEVHDPEDGAIVPGDIEVIFDYHSAGISNDIALSTSALVPRGAVLIDNSDCKACHMVDTEAVGPSYHAIAERYQDYPQAVTMLIEKIIAGGTGNWGNSMMSAHPQLSEGEAKDMVDYILSLNAEKEKKSWPTEGTFTFDRHKKEEGRGVYVLQAAYTDKGANGIEPLTGSDIIKLRPAKVRTALADAHVGFERYRDDLGHGGNAAYILLRDIDLTGIKKFIYEYNAAADGYIEVRIDSRAGPVIAKTHFQASNHWEVNEFLEAVIDQPVSGKHDVYFIVVRHEKPNQSIINISYITMDQ